MRKAELKILLSAVLSAAGMVAGLLSPVEAQVSQQAIAAELVSADRSAQLWALRRAEAIDASDVEQPLRQALIDALERESSASRERREALLRGVAHEEDDYDFHARLTHTVIRLRDPQTIPALAGVLGNGLMAVRALAAFGDRSVPAIVEAVRSPRSHSSLIRGGFIALRFIVEESKTRPLAAGTHQQIRSVVEQRLSGKGDFTTLWRAIDLAVVLDDPELREIVESLASDRSEVIARGIDDPDLIERTQKRAADGLAGVPPLPRP